MKTLDLTPDPKILIALTHTPLKPMDALCELIDNSIDSFSTATMKGDKIQAPLVFIDLPTKKELEEGAGKIVVRDNGPGLSPKEAEKALRAGYSGNNPFDRLGLFGMGFNIATGKLGVKTSFFSGTRESKDGFELLIDLEEFSKKRSYKVPYFTKPKPDNFKHGTVVEISGSWPTGNPNAGFAKKLVQYGFRKIREEIGRRYATILKNGNISILVNNEACKAFEHCIWSDKRYVERKNFGKINAVYHLNQQIGSQTRCIDCNVNVDGEKCLSCGSTNFRTINEVVRGWLGIQRFDHTTDFGIDLIRNGRAIRIGEKSAFFEYEDDFKNLIRDYPIDNPYGRIVGEVHLDHVPVDFLKQDFQRASKEWAEAINFLRGASSLQPNQPNANKNKSPLFKLYQGYRRVRHAGKAELYMGRWDSSTGRSRRISRQVEQEYYKKFLNREEGFYDDSEWYKLVEQADQKPVEELVECPACKGENPKEYDICASCGHILISKKCINKKCEKDIPKSAPTCQYCGTDQGPEIKEPWRCGVCGTQNPPSVKNCKECQSPIGALNPLSKEYLEKNSEIDDSLSFSKFSVELPNSSKSDPLDAVVRCVNSPIKPFGKKINIPIVIFKEHDLEIFTDLAHPVFRDYNLKPEFLISQEVALFIFDQNITLAGSTHKNEHNLSNLTYQILTKRWGENLINTPEVLERDIQGFFTALGEKLEYNSSDIGEDFYKELTEKEIESLTSKLLSEKKDLSRLGEMIKDGTYVKYLSPRVFHRLFRDHAEIFLDGNVWAINFDNAGNIPDKLAKTLKEREVRRLAECLGNLCEFVETENPDSFLIGRTRQALDYLTSRMV